MSSSLRPPTGAGTHKVALDLLKHHAMSGRFCFVVFQSVNIVAGRRVREVDELVRGFG